MTNNMVPGILVLDGFHYDSENAEQFRENLNNHQDRETLYAFLDSFFEDYEHVYVFRTAKGIGEFLKFNSEELDIEVVSLDGESPPDKLRTLEEMISAPENVVAKCLIVRPSVYQKTHHFIPDLKAYQIVREYNEKLDYNQSPIVIDQFQLATEIYPNKKDSKSKMPNTFKRDSELLEQGMNPQVLDCFFQHIDKISAYSRYIQRTKFLYPTNPFGKDELIQKLGEEFDLVKKSYTLLIDSIKEDENI